MGAQWYIDVWRWWLMLDCHSLLNRIRWEEAHDDFIAKLSVCVICRPDFAVNKLHHRNNLKDMID